jgi:type I restriction enzyme S subunit
MSVEGWKNNSLISLLKILKSGGTPNTSQSNFYGGDIPFVAIEDMSASRKYLCSTVKSLTKEGIKNSNAWLVPQNSLLYSIYATLGLVRINTIPVATNQAILAMIVNDEMVDQDYLYYWLEYIRDSVVNLSAQTTQSNLSATTVKPFVVQHPQNKQEQTQIATILSTIDRAIEQTEALIAKQQRIKTGLMQDLLTKGIDENGNIRSEETHEFKDSPLGRIPVEWEVKRLGETLEDITYGLTVRPKYVEEGIPLISAKECGNGSIDYESCNKIMQQDFKRLRERSLPKYGDVLITKTGTLGRVARINQSDPYSAITQNVALLRPNIKIIRPEFLEIILNSEKIQKDIKDGVTVLSIPDIQLGVLAKFEFPIPSLNEQDKLIRQIEKFDADTLLNKKYLSKIKLLKTGLMQDLLTGKVRVTDLLNQKTATN